MKKMSVIYLFFFFSFISICMADLDDILQSIVSNNPKNLSQYFLTDKILIGIEAVGFTLPESFYSARQGFYLLEKFSSYYELSEITDQQNQTSGETINSNLVVSAKDLKRNTSCRLLITISILKIEKKLSVNKLIIRETEN